MFGLSRWSLLLGFWAVCAVVVASEEIAQLSDALVDIKDAAVAEDIVQTVEEVDETEIVDDGGSGKNSGTHKHSIFKCPPFEIYLSCGPTCQLTCDSVSSSCASGPCAPGCFCKDEKVRSAKGKCIHKNQCRKYRTVQ